MTVELIDARSPHLDAVKALGDANRGTLGFFPEGAFDAYAERAQIIVALDDDGRCMGYLMYHALVSRAEISIVHLCVDPSRRRQGVSAALVEWLREATKRDYEGIRLKCRRDYDASHLWPRLGFKAQTEVAGRGAQRRPLTVWWLDHGHRSLLTASVEALAKTRLSVVLDANVLFSLQDEEKGGSTESRALLADWLADEVLLGATAETLNEINRHTEAAERRRRRRYLEHFHQFPASLDAVRPVEQRLRTLFREPLTESDESDVRQLAHAVASGVPYFVTRDTYLLGDDFANRVYADFGLSVVRPVDLVVRLDELVGAARYQPTRLAGSRVQIGRVGADDLARLDVFREKDLGERKGAYRDRLMRLLADPREAEGLVVQDAGGEPLALTAITRPTPDELAVPVLRVLPGPIAPTLATHIAMRHVLTAVREKRSSAYVTDPYLRDELGEALQRVGYTRTEAVWVKAQLPVVAPARDVIAQLAKVAQRTALGDLVARIRGELESAVTASDAARMLRAECALWPAKITDIQIPAYIVPIRPAWARHLLGQEPTQPSLFGSDPMLALGWDNAYYRAATGAVACPSRVLWYVSEERHDPGSKHVQACSLVEEVVVGTAREVFGRLRRLGVYEWRDVIGVARGDLQRPVMGFRFSHTELFSNPIAWSDLQDVLEAEGGKRSPVVTVTPVTPRCFYKLYGLGTQGG